MAHDAKRGRGRPRGSGKPDEPTLRKIADLRAADPKLKTTTAIKRVIGAKNSSAIRRLQVKLKDNGTALLAQAHERRRQVSAAQSIDLRSVFAIVGATVIALNRIEAQWRESPFFKVMQEAAARWKALEENWQNSPAPCALKSQPDMNAGCRPSKPP